MGPPCGASENTGGGAPAGHKPQRLGGPAGWTGELQCRVFADLVARANDSFDAARVLISEDRRRRLLAIGEAGSGFACGPQQTGAGTAPAAAPAAWGSCDCDLAELVLRSISSVPSRAKLSLVVQRSESVERARSRIAAARGVEAVAVSLLKEGRPGGFCTRPLPG